MERLKIVAVAKEESPETGEARYGVLLDNLKTVFPQGSKVINEILHEDVVGRYLVYDIKDGVLTYCEII
jgi:hypothetical protein